MLALLLLPQLAFAGDIHIKKKTGAEAWLYVDGQLHGKVTKKSHKTFTLPDGPHELWFFRDEMATYHLCRGVVDAGPTPVKVELTLNDCWGVTKGVDAPAGTAGKGGRLQIQSASGLTLLVDGAYQRDLYSDLQILNVAPGHTIQLLPNNSEEQACDGKVTVTEGQLANIIYYPPPTPCSGFNAP